MKTLCFLADARSPHTRKWVMSCASLNCRLVVISHHPGEIPGAEVIVHPLNLVGFFRWALPVRRLIRRLQPAVVHAHQFGAHSLYAWFSGCRPLVISGWGSDVLVKPRRSPLLRLLLRLQIRQANLITSASDSVTIHLQAYGARPERVYTFPFGIEQVVYSQLCLVEKASQPIVLCSPRLHEPLYNLKIVLKAFKEITADYPQVELWLLGDGSQTKELQDYVRVNRLERVKFWGRLSPDEAVKCIAASHIMVSIPSSDATPVSMLESMAAGSFPVLSDLPTYHTWVINHVNGLLVKPKVNELAQAMRRAIDDSELRAKAAEINRVLIRDKAIWETSFAKMLDYYRQELERTPCE